MFKEWLLKDEKVKVGRPKLASDEVLKKAKVSIALCTLVCSFMIIVFISSIKNISPFEYAYSLTFAKLGGTLNNKDGFIAKESYNKDNNYVIDINPSDKLKSYRGKYKYVLYRLEGSKWKKQNEKEFSNKTSVKVESKKNKNETYKINLYVLNASKIKDSFAPFSWKFVDSSKQDEKYAYKVFTVKGYYSPVSLEEIKEANKKEKTKVTITTAKKDAREFTINVPNVDYKLKVTYTDDVGKKILLVNENKLTGTYKFKVPNVNKISNVVVKVWIKDADNYKLSNWEKKTDKNNESYITNTYLVKPESNYKKDL